MIDVIPIHRLGIGRGAAVVSIQGGDAHIHRLREFGLLDGARVEMFRSGNPCIIRLAGGKVCLRSDDQVQVLVRPEPVAELARVQTDHRS